MKLVTYSLAGSVPALGVVVDGGIIQISKRLPDAPADMIGSSGTLGQKSRATFSIDCDSVVESTDGALSVSRPAGVTTLRSEGVCLVYGRGQAALDVAAELSGRLSVTALLSDPEGALPPGVVAVPIFKGRIRRATGAGRMYRKMP